MDMDEGSADMPSWWITLLVGSTPREEMRRMLFGFRPPVKKTATIYEFVAIKRKNVKKGEKAPVAAPKTGQAPPSRCGEAAPLGWAATQLPFF
jgi:hypothetical protein